MKNRYFSQLRFAVILLTFFMILLQTSVFASGRTANNYSSKQFYFTENKGQWDSRVLYKANASNGLTWFLEEDGITLLATSPQEIQDSQNLLPHELTTPLLKGQAIRFKFVNTTNSVSDNIVTASAEDIIPKQRDDYYHNYFIGNNPDKWQSRCANYRSILFVNVWDGIDVKWYDKNGNLEFDFIVHPSADISQICMDIQGLESELRLSDSDNALIIPTFLGDLETVMPEVYQVDANGRKEILESGFSLLSGTSFSVNVPENYDTSQKLIIDPLIASTYIGGTSTDRLIDIAEDVDGNLVLVGTTSSADYPVLNGVINTFGGTNDAVVSKVSSDCSTLLYSTYIGGTGNTHDSGGRIHLDENGDIWVGGSTQSTDFPTTPGVINETLSGNNDGYVLKLSADGSTILASTLIGGSGHDGLDDFKLDNNQNVYLVASTSSTGMGSAGAFDLSYSGNYDALVMKMNSSLNAVTYSTYLGGSGQDVKYTLIIEDDGCVTVSGRTTSSDFPTTPGAFDTSYNGGNTGYGGDAFITRLNADGSGLVWSTYLGGTGYESTNGAIVSDGAGGVIIGGNTLWSNFPTTPGAFQESASGDWDLFVTNISSDGSSLIYSTLIGASTLDVITALCVDENYNVIVAGHSMSNDYPVTSDAYQASHEGGTYDIIISKLKNDGTQLLYSTYFGGNGNTDSPSGVCITEGTRITFCGATSSTDFPITPGAYSSTISGGTDGDGFVASISTAGSFGLLTPVNESILLQPQIQLTWESVIPGQTSTNVQYEVFVSEDGAALISVNSGINDTTYTFNANTDDQDWEWTVVANNPTTHDIWYSDTLSFSTAFPDIPAEFALLNPSNGEQVNSLTPTLSWEEAVDPDPGDEVTYTLYWSINNIYFIDADSITGLTETSYTFPEDILLLGNRGNVNASNYSDRSVRFNKQIKSHSNNGQSVSQLIPGSNKLLESELDELPENVTVYWKVRAVDTNTSGRFSTPEGGWYFNTADSENYVNISASMNTGDGLNLADNDNQAGFNSSATDGYDHEYDIPEPLASNTPYLSLYFPHEEWTAPVDNFMADVRDADDDLTDDVKTFQFVSETDQDGETVNLAFDIGDGYPANYGVVLNDPVALTYQDLREDLSYSFIAGEDERNMELILGDATAPVITFTAPVDDELWDVNTTNTVSWDVTDVSAIRDISLSYSCDNGLTWTNILTLTDQYIAATSFEWVTPDTFSTLTKLRLNATDWAGNSTEYDMPYTFNIAAHRVSMELTSPWNMISLPIHPDDERVPMIFDDDDLGAYFVYAYTQGTGYTVEDSAFYTSGYWLYQTNDSVVDVNGIPEVDSSYQSLTTGWNIAASAFPVSFPSDSLRFKHDDDLVYFDAAVDSGWVLPSIYAYNSGDNSYSVATDLDVWSGYWLFAVEADIEMVTYPTSPAAEPQMEVDDLNEVDMLIPISLSMGSYSDLIAAIGFTEDATDEYDNLYDLATPPLPPSDFVRLTMDRDSWNAPVRYFSQDIRSELENGESTSWPMVIEASETGDVNIAFPELEDILPDDYSIILHHNNENIDLRETPSLTIEITEDYPITITITNGQVAVRNQWHNSIPEEYSIASTYPNPFNPSLNIVIGMAEHGNLELGVYNILGQLVSKLADNNIQAGYHTFTFKAEGLSSGIYFVKAIVPGKMNSIKKVVLTR